ncbi:hypothetical protein E2C01_045001 [Portunus trituberculatus]|uniref:Uncharacterized protein n=1 Tax=Portunus trituberculatus TaxID=210409 RepID=A0A5B7FUJ8_PORTR|nr:hypothetical protein [Portunus trituberculatus]
MNAGKRKELLLEESSGELVLGNWWYNRKGAAVTWVDLDLRQHGEGGTPPKDYAFTFIAGQCCCLPPQLIGVNHIKFA